MAVLITIAVIVALVAGAVAAAVWFFQERIAFQPQGPPFPAHRSARKVSYTASDGTRLFAYVVGQPDSSTSLLIVFHGNADLAIRQLEWAEEIQHRTGVSVMLAEYRGYMGIPGRPTYAGSKLDAEAAYEYAVTNLAVKPGRIAFFGHSLGTAIASELALRHKPAALILQSPFTSARDMAALIAGKWITRLTWRLVSRVHFDNIGAVKLINAPVSVVHGGRDGVIPAQMGRAVYDAAKIKGDWLFVRNASHSDVPVHAGEEYWIWLARALEPVQSSR